MAGQLWLWGNNGYGNLGDNTNINKSSPVQTVTFATNWSSLFTGFYHVGAIKTDGTLWLWGRGLNGTIGDNTIANRSSPVQTIAGGINWSKVACGPYNTAAIKTDGTLWIWGRNNGTLGDNTITDRSSPVQTVTGGTNWSVVACGRAHTAAIKTDGTLWTWGDNSHGQLGDNTLTNKSSPIQTITGGNNWSSVACGYNFVAAIKTDGTLWLWGQNTVLGAAGQLGDNTGTNKSSPVQTITGGNNWSSVACGRSHTAALKRDGTLWTWGLNSYGNLGDNTSIRKSSPIQTISAGNNWSFVACGYQHTTATKTDGSLWAWGRNNDGQLGDNTLANKSSPIQTVMVGNRWFTVGGGYSTAAIYENLPSALSVTTQPANAYTAQKLLNQPVVTVIDSSGAIVTITQPVITATIASGTPSLTGTTNILVSGGIAQYTDLTLSGLGSGSLIFTASGLTSAISSYVAVEQSSIAIVPKRTETSGRIPYAEQLRNGELAINLADKKGYVKNSSGSIVNVFTGLGADVITSGMIGENAINMRDIAPGAIGPSELASGVIGGTNTQILYNSSGAITGTAAFTLSTASGVVTIAPQNAGYNALTLRSFTSQTADLLKVQNSAGTDIARITSSGEWIGPLGSGNIVSGYIASGQIGAFHLASGVGGGSAAGASGMLQYNFGNAFGPTSGLTYSVTSGTPLVQATSQTAFNANFALKASSGQVSNLTEWKNTSGSNLAYMDVSGNFFAVSKSFLIDHPTKPGKKLRHVSLEGPTADVFFRGKTKDKVINLPEYWIGLVDYENITVMLTPIGKDQTLYVDKIEDNKVYIDGNAFPNYHYMIIAERADIEKIVVEE
jgi:alpha-tubulin suppressor-like RCC1 family protein